MSARHSHLHPEGKALMRALHIRFALAVSILGAVVLGACALGGGTASTTTTNPTATTPSGCAATPGFQTAGAATAGTHFTDISFPTGAVGKISAAPEANGFQYQLLSACATGQTPSSVTGYYHTQMASQGWMIQATAPVTGDMSTACPAGSVCYAKGGAAIRYVVLQPPVVSGSVTTWTLQLIVQPLAFGGAELSTSNHTLDVDPLGPGSGNDDLSWSDAALSLLNSGQAVSLGLEGSLNTVAYADLSGASYASSALSIGSLPPGTVIAVHTGDGHYAKARVTAVSGGALDLDYVTYAYAL
jgi:hypothetical protein